MKIFSKTVLLASVIGISAQAMAGTISLSGVDATGYAAITGVNNEFGSADSYPGTEKGFKYPYYWNADKNYWEVIVAEKLSANSTYIQEGQYSVLGKTETDADFSNFSLGSITYVDSAVSATGTSTVAVNGLTLSIDASEFSPVSSSRNVNNEFSWDYQITASNVQGNGLTFVDGVLESIDLTADLKVTPRLFNPQFNLYLPFNPGFEQAASFTISGNQLAFDFDQSSAQMSALGPIANPRMIINRSGTIDAVAVSEVPVPAAAWLFGSALLGLVFKKRR